MNSKDKLALFKWLDKEFLQDGIYADFQMTIVNGKIVSMRKSSILKIDEIILLTKETE